MTTLFVGATPPEIANWLNRRRELGQDRRDEVWDGVYHVAPGPSKEHAYVDGEIAGVVRQRAKAVGVYYTTAFNIGTLDDFRVPDGGLHRDRLPAVFVPTAAMVIEILSPGDETFAKFGFYWDHEVDEVLVADPAERTVRIWQRGEDYVETGHSALLDVAGDTLAAELDWP